MGYQESIFYAKDKNKDTFNEMCLYINTHIQEILDNMDSGPIVVMTLKKDITISKDFMGNKEDIVNLSVGEKLLLVGGDRSFSHAYCFVEDRALANKLDDFSAECLYFKDNNFDMNLMKKIFKSDEYANFIDFEDYIKSIEIKSEFKKLNVTYQYSMIGTVSMDVPEYMNIDEAIKYAKQNVNELPLPQNANYLDGSCIVDEENCDFVVE